MSLVRRPQESLPLPLFIEHRRIAGLGVPYARIKTFGDSTDFFCEFTVPNNLRKIGLQMTGADVCGQVASIEWIRQGPKIADVTEEQYQALSKVDVNLELKDFSAPYPCVLVNYPPGKTHRYTLVCRWTEEIMICASISHDNLNDITTVIRQRDGVFVEAALEKYAPDLADVAEECCCSLRVALNMLLAMANYGCYSEYLYPREVEQEKKYIAKGDWAGRDGRKASDRIKEQPVLLTLDRNVKLFRSHKSGSEPASKTGREMCCHSRRGHWAMQPHGPGGSLRKPVLRPPVLVRADKLVGDIADMNTVYRT